MVVPDLGVDVYDDILKLIIEYMHARTSTFTARSHVLLARHIVDAVSQFINASRLGVRLWCARGSALHQIGGISIGSRLGAVAGASALGRSVSRLVSPACDLYLRNPSVMRRGRNLV